MIDVVARWPGSIRGSIILEGSQLYQSLSDGVGQGQHYYLLGDSGYPCTSWLLAPNIHHVGMSQVQYDM